MRTSYVRHPQVEVGVRARTQQGDRFSDARVVVRLRDINDNAPVFEQQVMCLLECLKRWAQVV